MDPSGIRFGTPALTTRGFSEDDCIDVANLMIDVLTKRTDAVIEQTHTKILNLASTHTIPSAFA